MFKKKILVLILLYLFISNIAYAENKIAYLDMNFLINRSDVGISINEQTKALEKKFSNELKKKEEILQKEKQSIISQKNILEKEEFEKKIMQFNAKLNVHQKKKNKSINDISKKRLEASQNFLNEVTKILAKYSTENSISIIIQKKNIVIGMKELDITEDILEISNQKIKKIEIK